MNLGVYLFTKLLMTDNPLLPPSNRDHGIMELGSFQFQGLD